MLWRIFQIIIVFIIYCFIIGIISKKERARKKQLGEETTMTREVAARFLARRSIQLKNLIEVHFQKQQITYKAETCNEQFGDNSWLFRPGNIFHCENGRVIISMRGHLLKFEQTDPNKIIYWIFSDVGIKAVLSENDDVIAYDEGISHEIIHQILEICNNARCNRPSGTLSQ